MNKKLKKEITRMRIPRYESRINENCEKIFKKKKIKSSSLLKCHNKR